MPRVVKKRRKVDEDGSMEECESLQHGGRPSLMTNRFRPHLSRRRIRAEFRTIQAITNGTYVFLVLCVVYQQLKKSAEAWKKKQLAAAATEEQD